MLIRGCEPVRGHALIEQRRSVKTGPAMLAGPGKVAAALGLDRGYSGHCLYQRGGLEVRQGTAPTSIVSGPRIGIAYASPEHQHAPWRLAIADNLWVSRRKALR